MPALSAAVRGVAGWAEGRGDGAQDEGDDEQDASDRQAAQDADVVG